MRAAVFPGQGSQRTGMGEALFHVSPHARSFYDRAGEVLGLDVAGLCFRSSPAVLAQTRNAQIAITVTNLAAYEVLLAADLRPDIVAGHSVGELAAVAAAGVLDVDELLRVVAQRGELMGSVTTPGAMLAIVGCPAADVEAACANVGHIGPAVVAVYNSSVHVVVSGAEAAVEEVARRLRRPGVRTTRLEVSHAFHSPLMAPVVDDWRTFLDRLPFADPEIPIVTNVTGQPVTRGSSVREALVSQLTMPVRWDECVTTLRHSGVDIAVETGDSRFLSRLHRGLVASRSGSSRGVAVPLRMVPLREVTSVPGPWRQRDGVRNDAV